MRGKRGRLSRISESDDHHIAFVGFHLLASPSLDPIVEPYFT
jgi:hypothetical protein